MAYTINEKVYTSHSLMDEIVYNCKIILNGIIIKNETEANNNETEESLEESDYFLSIMNESMSLSFFPLNTSLFIEHGFTKNQAINFCNDVSNLPEYVECTLQRYDSSNTSTVVWNPYYARYEYLNGKIAGINIYTQVYYNQTSKRFEYEDGTEATGKIVGYADEYYTDYLGNYLFYDSESDTYSLADGNITSANPIHCICELFREYANNYYSNEKNNYYRMLNGKPAYGTDEYNIYIDPKDYSYAFSLDDDNTEFNFSLPIHEFSNKQINTLDSLGILSTIIDTYYTNNTENAKQYKYLKFLGSKSIDIYTARIASNWDILYMPACENLVKERFKELYKLNRDIYYRRTYQTAYSYGSDYFDECIMIMILCQTFNDMIVDIPEWYIRRDIFDLRTAKYFLESNGVKFFEEIPLKYQIRIVKNLNTLIKYKSTLKNINDILSIFSVEDVTVYKYYLLKNYLYTKGTIHDPNRDHIEEEPFINEEDLDFEDDDDYPTVRDMTDAEIFDFYDENSGEEYPTKLYLYDFENEDANKIDNGNRSDKQSDYAEQTKIIYDEVGNVYELEFIKVPLGDEYDDYIKDSLSREDYDIITKQDKYWDGENVHYYVRNNHLEKDFTVEGTKFMGLQYNVSISDYDFQKEYYLGMYFNSSIDTSDLRISVPSIKQDAEFTLQNLFIFLYCCNGIYNDIDIDVNDITGFINTSGNIEEFTPYKDYNGGRPWDEDGEDIIPEEDEVWEVPELDFGDEEDPNYDFSRDQFTEYYDFGYNYVIDPTEYLFNYDYGLITNTSIDTDEQLATELSEPATWPVQDFGDFGDEEGINLYSEYTKDYDFNDTSITDDPLVYDYRAEIVSNESLLPDTSDTSDKSEDHYPPYYVQANDMQIFMYYDYDVDQEQYVLLYDYSGDVPPDEPFEYDTKLTITEDNYITYIGHYNVNQVTGEITKITADNIEDYIGKFVWLRYPWYNITPNHYILDLDGHHLYEDEDHDDVYYDEEDEKWYKNILVADKDDREEAVGEISPVMNNYRLVVDGGDVKYNSFITKETYYDWLRSNYPQFWTNVHGRIYGFNMGVDLTEVSNNIGARHSEFGWEHGYTLSDVGCDTFIAQSAFSSIDELLNTYNTNKECYDKLVDKMNNSNSRDEKRVLEYVFDQLFTVPYNKLFYMLKSGEYATTYDQILQERDYTLYSYYEQLKAEEDPDTRKELVREVLNNLVDTLNYYISGDNLRYVLSFVSTNSFDSIMNYITLLINFFKSWKVHFLEPKSTYTLDDKRDNLMNNGDAIGEIRVGLWNHENLRSSDTAIIKPKYYFEEDDNDNMNRNAEVVDIASHYVNNNIFKNRDYDGGSPEEVVAGESVYEDLDGGPVSNSMNVSYYLEDGGNIGCIYDLKDLNGSGPGLLTRDQADASNRNYLMDTPELELVDDIIDLDGGDPSSISNRDINGGTGRSNRWIRSSTIETYITPNTNYIQMDTIISKYRRNGIEIRDDGLYVSNSYATSDSIVDFKDTMTNFEDRAVNTISNMHRTLIAYGSLEGAEEIINSIFSDYFNNAITVMDKLRYTDYDDNIAYGIDTRLSTLKDWFIENNPFANAFGTFNDEEEA